MGQTERNNGKQKIDRLTKTRITNRPIISIRILLVHYSQRHCFLQSVNTQDIYNQRCYHSNNSDFYLPTSPFFILHDLNRNAFHSSDIFWTPHNGIIIRKL